MGRKFLIWWLQSFQDMSLFLCTTNPMESMRPCFYFVVFHALSIFTILLCLNNARCLLSWSNYQWAKQNMHVHTVFVVQISGFGPFFGLLFPLLLDLPVQWSDCSCEGWIRIQAHVIQYCVSLLSHQLCKINSGIVAPGSCRISQCAKIILWWWCPAMLHGHDVQTCSNS